MCNKKKSKQEINYFGTTTVTVFAGFVKNTPSFFKQELSTFPKFSNCQGKKKCLKLCENCKNFSVP
jgi:hypothetical protein